LEGEEEMNKRKGGWQVWVEIHKDHVIKTPKTKREIRDHIKPHLKATNKLNELSWRVDAMLRNVKNSIRLIKRSKAPRRLFGNPEFLEDGRIKQDLAIQLEDKMSKANSKNLIDQYIRLILELWKYGVHEKTFKFYSNFGLIKDKVIMIDFLELTGNKKTVLRQIRKRQCDRPFGLKRVLSEELADYYVKQANKYFTVENFNKNWKTKV
jgi:hypothetical protein